MDALDRELHDDRGSGAVLVSRLKQRAELCPSCPRGQRQMFDDEPQMIKGLDLLLSGIREASIRQRHCGGSDVAASNRMIVTWGRRASMLDRYGGPECRPG